MLIKASFKALNKTIYFSCKKQVAINATREQNQTCQTQMEDKTLKSETEHAVLVLMFLFLSLIWWHLKTNTILCKGMRSSLIYLYFISKKWDWLVFPQIILSNVSSGFLKIFLFFSELWLPFYSFSVQTVFWGGGVHSWIHVLYLWPGNHSYRKKKTSYKLKRWSRVVSKQNKNPF